MAYSASLWSKLKAAYESGQHTSIESAYSKLQKKYGKIPSLKSIQDRATKENWEKAKLAPEIEKAIVEETISAAAKLGITPEKVLTELALVAFSDMAEYVTIEDGGKVTPKTITQLSNGASRVIKKIREKRSIRQTSDDSGDILCDDTFEFELHDKMGALDKLGKHLGLFTDQAPIEINFPTQIQIKSIKSPTKGTQNG
jgi:hypothetical protein